MQILLQYKFHFEQEERMQINFIRDFIFSLSKDKHQRLWIITKTLKAFSNRKMQTQTLRSQTRFWRIFMQKSFFSVRPKGLMQTLRINDI